METKERHSFLKGRIWNSKKDSKNRGSKGETLVLERKNLGEDKNIDGRIAKRDS